MGGGGGEEVGTDDHASVHPAQITFRILIYTGSGLQVTLGRLAVAV